jgi:hypothetical protein
VVEDIDVQELDDLLHAQGRFTQELDLGQQQVDAHGNPDLGHHSILAGTEKSLSSEVLLNPLEEQLHLPAGLVNRSD